jgi:hypothetical protein
MPVKYLRSCLDIVNCGRFFEVRLDPNADVRKVNVECPFCHASYRLPAAIPTNLSSFGRPPQTWHIVIDHEVAGRFEFENGKWSHNDNPIAQIYNPPGPIPSESEGVNLRYIIPEQIRALVVYLGPGLVAGNMRIISID